MASPKTTTAACRLSALLPAAAVVVIATLAATIGAGVAHAAERWYQADLHRHSALSADGRTDLGIVAENMRSLGYNAVFVTDHDRGSDFQISGSTANKLKMHDSITAWKPPLRYGRLSSSANALVTSGVHSGTHALRLAAGAAVMGETMLWNRRGPNMRSGDIIMDFWVNPTSIGAGSGVYASVSIGGDETVEPPSGYTSTAGVTTVGASNVLVWQIGSARAPSSAAGSRVLTQSLPYTLKSWNHYTINVSTGATRWNGAVVNATNSGLQAIPAAERPEPQNGLTYIKLAARSNGTPVEAYFDDFSLTASSPRCPAEEFVHRNSQIAANNRSDFVMFPSREMGQTKHTQQLNFAITDPRDYAFGGETALCGATNDPSAPYQWRRFGSDAIPAVHASGYPAINNHPGSTDSAADVIATRGHGADGIEAHSDYTYAWDAILGQNYPITGSGATDAHHLVGRNGVATYLRASSLTLDDLMASYFEGRLYVGPPSFGRMALNLDGSSEPHPGRHPVYVPASQTAASVSLDVSAGLAVNDTIRWVTNNGSGPVAKTVTRTGASYQETRSIALSGAFTYVRAEVRDAGGVLKAFTQPIFFRRVSGLPSLTSYHVDRTTTASGRGYTNVSTLGITASSYDSAAARLSVTLVNPAGTRTNLLGTSSTAPQSVTVNGATVPRALLLLTYHMTGGSSWYYEAGSRRIHLQVVQPGGTANVAVAFGGGGPPTDAQPPSVPSGVTATAAGSSRIDLAWQASTDDVGVASYRIRRDGALLATADSVATAYSDLGPSPATTYSYTVEAVDAAGRGSGESAPASATTAPLPVGPATTFNPVADAYVQDSTPTSNFGAAATLRADGASPVQLSYLRFAVSGLTRPPTRAVLRVYANSSHSIGYAVFGVANTTWIERGPTASTAINFVNAPSLATTATGSSGPATAGTFTTVDVTRLVSGNGPVGVALRTTGSSGLSLASREAVAGRLPELVVTP